MTDLEPNDMEKRLAQIEQKVNLVVFAVVAAWLVLAYWVYRVNQSARDTWDWFAF